MKRLAVVSIGDEILGGHVHESNSHFVARIVKPMGIKLGRVTICSDDVADIEETVRRQVAFHRFDYVLTSGGLGPTPDDRTMEGVARAFGMRLESAEPERQWMRQRVLTGHELGYFREREPNDGLWKMTWLPVGCGVMPNHVGTALGAIVTGGPGPTTLFTLPGPPVEFERMFHEYVAPRLEAGPPIHTEELVIQGEESRYYTTLCELERRYPDVQIGSYPERGQIRIRATGPRERALEAIAAMRAAAK